MTTGRLIGRLRKLTPTRPSYAKYNAATARNGARADLIMLDGQRGLAMDYFVSKYDPAREAKVAARKQAVAEAKRLLADDCPSQWRADQEIIRRYERRFVAVGSGPWPYSEFRDHHSVADVNMAMFVKTAEIEAAFAASTKHHRPVMHN